MTKTFPNQAKYFVYVLLIALLTFGCGSWINIWDPQPVAAPQIPTSDFLLESTSFPQGWDIFPCEPNCEGREAGTSTRGFGVPGGYSHVNQDVFYFGSEEDAQQKFETYKETDLSNVVHPVRAPYVPFVKPQESTYSSLIADQQYFGCGVDVVPACTVGLRYGNYFVYFYFSLKTWSANGQTYDNGAGDGLTLEEIEQILKVMDERVSEVLSDSPE